MLRGRNNTTCNGRQLIGNCFHNHFLFPPFHFLSPLDYCLSVSFVSSSFSLICFFFFFSFEPSSKLFLEEKGEIEKE